MSGTRVLARVGRLALEFKLRDLWVGAFWTATDVWVCLLPCLPIHYRRALPVVVWDWDNRRWEETARSTTGLCLAGHTHDGRPMYVPADGDPSGWWND